MRLALGIEAVRLRKATHQPFAAALIGLGIKDSTTSDGFNHIPAMLGNRTDSVEV
jgi:hypothetical protein